MGTMPASRIEKPKATYEDLLRVPDHKVAEIVDGELFVSPRPASLQALAKSVLGGDLGGPFHQGRDGPGGWWIVYEPEIHFGEDVVVPDIVGWQRERMAVFPTSAFFTLAPDWVCEVLSPSTERLDRARKLRVYARAGVGHAWLVNPTARTLEVYRRAEEQWLLLGTFDDDALVRAEPFDAIELDLLPLWGETRQGMDETP
jgi:Uma2 family endonuclease